MNDNTTISNDDKIEYVLIVGEKYKTLLVNQKSRMDLNLETELVKNFSNFDG